MRALHQDEENECHTNPIVKLICKIALTSARSPVGANMAFLRCKYGADFDTSVHTLLNCINVYHELDESHCSILNVLGELLDCKSESSYIDCLNPDDIDCMVYCILTQ